MGYGGVHNTQGNSGEVGVFLCSKIGNGMDIFWNYTIWKKIQQKKYRMQMRYTTENILSKWAMQQPN